MVVYVVGHRNPDTDSVCAAVAVANLKKMLGEDAVACVQGEVAPEARFVLRKFGFEQPEVLTDGYGKELILVDHSEVSQSVDNLSEAQIVGIVDHHKLGDVTTSSPLDVLIRPVGCTCTIIKGLFDYYGKEISKDIAGLMLCAILSDTVIFRSVTTTDEDRRVVEELAEIAEVVDVEELGMEMFKVKSDIKGISARDLLMRDYKDFVTSGKRIGVGQLELVDLGMIKNRKGEFLEEMRKLKDDGREAVFFMLTDIIKEGSVLLCVSECDDLKEKIFGEGDGEWYEGMMSRKKQVVPLLEKYFGG